MPTCCPSTPIGFNEAITTINYTSLMQQQYGPTPRVHVWYRDPDTLEWYLSNAFFTRIDFKDNVITIDHGGVQVGYAVIR